MPPRIFPSTASWFHLPCVLFVAGLLPRYACSEERPLPAKWLPATAYAVPKETTNQGSGYFSIVTGKNGNQYIGTAKYGVSSYLVEFDSKKKSMQALVDTQKEIGVPATGFAAQSKIHTRNNVTGQAAKSTFGYRVGRYPGKERKARRLPRRLSVSPHDPGIPHMTQASISSRFPIRESSAHARDERAAWRTFRHAPTAGPKSAFRDDPRSRNRKVPRPDRLRATCTPLSSSIISGGPTIRSAGRYCSVTIHVPDKLERLKQTIDDKSPTKESASNLGASWRRIPSIGTFPRRKNPLLPCQ